METLIDANSRWCYSVTELELASVEWATRKCRLFLLGLPKPFTLVVDHQALVTILDKHTLGQIENEKTQRLKQRLSKYIFNTVWKKGKEHAIPGALSRFPVNRPSSEDLAAGETLQRSVPCPVRQWPTLVAQPPSSTADACCLFRGGGEM